MFSRKVSISTNKLEPSQDDFSNAQEKEARSKIKTYIVKKSDEEKNDSSKEIKTIVNISLPSSATHNLTFKVLQSNLDKKKTISLTIHKKKK